MFGVVEIGLIQGASLAAINRSGIAVPELIEIRRIEIDHPARAAIQLDREMRAVDRLDGAGVAVMDAGLLVGRGELDSIASRKSEPAMGRVELVILAQLSPPLPYGAQRRIELLHI